MKVRRWLVVLPIVVLAVLLQSVFWAPSYESQGEGNEARFTTYIEAGIGDAKILNPIISADGASSDVEALIFDGLIDVDENDQWVGDLAERWDTTEEAFLTVVPGRRFADGSPASAGAVVERVEAALAGPLADLRDAFVAAEVVPAVSEARTLTVTEPDENGQPKIREVGVRIEAPERVRFSLSRVVPEWFERLEPLLGAELLAEEGIDPFLVPDEAADRDAVLARAAELLVVREHRPILTFHLRKGVRFHDGHLFDAHDVRFTYDAILDPRNVSPRSSSYEPVRSVEVLDDHTVRITYKRLYSPAIIAWAMGMLPEHRMNDAALEAEMDRRGITGDARETFGLKQSDTARNPVGTGPFRFVEWKKDEYIHLERFDDHFAGPAEFEQVYMRVVPDLITQEIEFKAGAVDNYAAQPHQVARYRADERYRTVSTVVASYSYIGYNLRKPIFQDVRVRRALAMAIDIEELVRYVLYGEGQAVSGPSYVNTPYYDPATPIVPYDPEGAKRLLAEAGWTPGADGVLQKDGERLAFKLTTNNGNPQRKAILTVAQDAWRQLGIDVATQAFEWNVFLEDVNKLEFDAIVLSWGGGRLNPDKFQLWHSSQVNPYQLNFTGFQDERVDELIEAIRIEYDQEKQAALAQEMHARIAALQPYTFLYAPKASVVLDPRTVIVDREADGSERYRPVEAVNGTVKFHLDQWRKLPSVPVFEEAG